MAIVNSFIKIILSYKWPILANIGIFIVIAVAMVIFTPEGETEFPVISADIAIFDRDNTEITEGLILYLESMYTLAEVEDDIEAWHDAVSFSYIRFIIEIPYGFSESFILQNNEITIDYLISHSSSMPFFIRHNIERYFRILGTYLELGFGMYEAVTLTISNLGNYAQVNLVEIESVRYSAYFYFRFLPISLLLVIILSLGGIFIVLNNRDLMRRIMCSSTSLRKQKILQVTCCFAFGLISWLIFIALSFILFPEDMMQMHNILRVVNSFPLVLLGISISFFMSQFINSRELLFQTVYSIVMIFSFIGGIAIDLQSLADEIIVFARFTPLYWYSLVNDMLINEPVIDYTLLLYGVLIQILFTVSILALSLVFSKERILKNV